MEPDRGKQMIEDGIRKASSGIQPGEKTRVYCPFCHADDEKSLSIQRDTYQPHKLWFRCFRGKCGQKGMVKDAAGTYMILHAAERPEEEHRAMPQYEVPPYEFITMVEDRYGIPGDMLRRMAVRYDPENEGLVMPWLDQTGAQFGWLHKQFKKGVPKSKHDNVFKKKSRLAFPLMGAAYKALKGKGVTALLVEDYVSAMKLLYCAGSAGLPIYPVALNGARISHADAAIVSELFDNVVVCLDFDQWPAGALDVLANFKALPVRQVATTLRRDPKDTPAGELQEWLPTLMELF